MKSKKFLILFSLTSSLWICCLNIMVNPINIDTNDKIDLTPTEIEQGIPKTSTTKEWTILIYIDADCNLEAAGIGDINEMETEGSDANINVVVQIDRIPGYDTSNGNWNDARRYYITKDYDGTAISSTLMQYLNEVNMGDPTTLRNFIQWGKSNYPANNYALILWDHGSGILWGDEPGGVCWDDSSSDDYLTLSELKTVLSNPTYSVDLVGFDACLMGSIEVHYQLKDCVDVIVGSEETEPGDGYPYNDILRWLRANPTATPQQLAQQIVIKYDDAYPSSMEITQATSDALTSEFITSLNNFIDDLNSTVAGQKAGIYSAWTNCIHFADEAYIDLYDFADEVISSCSGNVDISAQYLMNNISTIIIEERHSSHYSGAGGFSIYFPKQLINYESIYEFTDFATDLLWDEFLENYYTGGATNFDDDFEENDEVDSASIITSGYYAPLFCNASDQDYYNISVRAGTMIEVLILFSNSDGDLDLFLYNTSGDLVNSSESTEDYEYVSYIVDSTGYYTIVVYQIGSNEYVPYEMYVAAPIPDDPYEDYDDIDHSLWIANNTLYTDLVCIDSDFFAVWAEETYVINITIWFSDVEGDLDLYLYDQYGDLLAGSYTASDNENILYYADYSGFYYFEIYNYEDNLHYSFSANVTNIDDPYESNNDFSDATDLSGYITWDNLVCLNSDYYNITLSAGIWINITLIFDNEQGDIDLSLYDSTEDEIAWSWSITDNEIIYYNVITTGVYYIEVIPYEYNLNYTLCVNPTTQVREDEFEENDDLPFAYPFALDQTYSNLSAIDLDCYSINVLDNYQITITLDYNVSEGDIDLYLLDNSADFIAMSTTMTDQDQIIFTPAYNGVYYIVVYNYEINMHYNLTLSKISISSDDDDDDKNGDDDGSNTPEILGFPLHLIGLIMAISVIFLIKSKYKIKK